MPVEVKPLFRPDVLQQRLKTFPLPERVEQSRGLVRKWADLLSSPQSDALKEQELFGGFLNDIFTAILGYTRPADSPERYTISRERHVEVDGKFADAVLGEFTLKTGTGSGRAPDVDPATDHPTRPVPVPVFQPGKGTGTSSLGAGPLSRPVVAVEGKGPTDPLDRPYKNRRMSAVDQGYRYAINSPATGSSSRRCGRPGSITRGPTSSPASGSTSPTSPPATST